MQDRVSAAISALLIGRTSMFVDAVVTEGVGLPAVRRGGLGDAVVGYGLAVWTGCALC